MLAFRWHRRPGPSHYKVFTAYSVSSFAMAPGRARDKSGLDKYSGGASVAHNAVSGSSRIGWRHRPDPHSL